VTEDPELTTVGQTFDRLAAAYADRIYLHHRSEAVTYAELFDRVSHLASGLAAIGIGRGDHVAVMLPNCEDFIVLFYALAKLGAVQVPINPKYRGEPLDFVLRHCDATVLVAEADRLRRLQSELELAPSLTTLVGRGDVSPVAASSTSTVVSLQALYQTGGGGTFPEVAPSDLVAIIYTGGTTGPPKGVMITHNFAVANIKAQSESYERPILDTDGTFLCCLPLFHGIQFHALLTPLLVGAQLAIIDKFSASRFWNDVRDSGATMTMLVGGMVPILWSRPERADDLDHPLQYIVGNPMPEDIHSDFERRFGVKLLDGYAVTETLALMTSTLDGTPVGSCGRPMPGGAEVRVVDSEGRDLRAGVEGEFVARPRVPYTIMDGYYKQPDETLEAFHNLWYHTKDIGYQDEAGFMYFVRRETDAIRRRGTRIAVYDIEQTAARYDCVIEAALVGVPDALGDDELKIVLELEPGTTFETSGFIAFLRESLPEHMVPRYVELVESLPRSVLGRVQKQELRDSGTAGATWDGLDQAVNGDVQQSRSPGDQLR
jgi:crotonobetaine/carnitine-CoA ligase